jgi:hypothetical protein
VDHLIKDNATARTGAALSEDFLTGGPEQRGRRRWDANRHPSRRRVHREAPTISTISIIRFTYPISLSDHATTFTHVPSTTVLEERRKRDSGGAVAVSALPYGFEQGSCERGDLIVEFGPDGNRLSSDYCRAYG